ncbi:MAG: response regulator [Elusimicrobia bacterium]|nr:response regulator [Elusimicrobiota bacterium]
MAKKILVVDDDAELVEFVVDVLKKAGYATYAAYQGQEGLDVARKERPDLVLLDLAMPVMHGFQVCRELRSDENLKNVRIITLSGKSYAVDLKTAKAEGADHTLVKPVSGPQLLDIVERVLCQNES